jgi:hypothetical protein
LRIERQSRELSERVYVPAPPAADVELASAADKGAEAVPLRLVGVAVLVGQAARAISEPVWEVPARVSWREGDARAPCWCYLPRDVFFFGFGLVEPLAALVAAFFVVFLAGISPSLWLELASQRWLNQRHFAGLGY